MPFGLSSDILNLIIHAKFHVERLRSFWAAGVLHYRADCDLSKSAFSDRVGHFVCKFYVVGDVARNRSMDR